MNERVPSTKVYSVHSHTVYSKCELPKKISPKQILRVDEE